MEIRTLPLDHLGLVAGIFDQLEIAELIDDRIPKGPTINNLPNNP